MELISGKKKGKSGAGASDPASALPGAHKEIPASLGGSRDLLEVENLSVAFDGEEGLVAVTHEVSFTIAPGQTLALVGESGCGKSVTAGAIMRLLPHPAGRIVTGSVRFDGRDILAMKAAELYRLRGSDIAMIFQEPMTSLNPVHSALDQIVEVFKLHRPDIPARNRTREAIALLDEVEIADAVHRASSYPFQLSGGMRQRVMIAMALAGRPRLLIADEATTALDVTVQAQILKLLERLRKDHDMAMLYITHDMGVVKEIADRVIVMYAGEVVESGTVEQIFDMPLHPYTKGLIAATPTLESKPRSRLNSIQGTVPPPSQFPSYCRFAERCPIADDESRAGPVPLRDVLGRKVRCLKVAK